MLYSPRARTLHIDWGMVTETQTIARRPLTEPSSVKSCACAHVCVCVHVCVGACVLSVIHHMLSALGFLTQLIIISMMPVQ